jgi:hypothetical protein
MNWKRILPLTALAAGRGLEVLLHDGRLVAGRTDGARLTAADRDWLKERKPQLQQELAGLCQGPRLDLVGVAQLARSAAPGGSDDLE